MLKKTSADAKKTRRFYFFRNYPVLAASRARWDRGRGARRAQEPLLFFRVFSVCFNQCLCRGRMYFSRIFSLWSRDLQESDSTVGEGALSDFSACGVAICNNFCASVMINQNWNGLKMFLSYSFFTYWTNWNFAFDSKIFTRITRIAIARTCWRADWIIAKKSLILNGFRAESVAWAGLGRISRIGFARRLFGARTCTDWPGLKWDTSESW